MKNKSNQTILIVLISLIIITVGVAILIGRMTMHKEKVIITGNSPPPTATPTPSGLEPTELTSQPNLTITQPTATEEATLEPTLSAQAITLVVTQPIDGSIVTIPTVIVQGKTAPAADVFVDDKQLTADALGNFSQSLTLDEGENTISVSANDANGNYAEKEIIITYNSPQTE